MARNILVFLVVGTAVCLLGSASSAGVPHMINYQGKLTTAAGGCLNDTVQMTFSIYPDTLPGTPADWTETQTEVIVKEGVFSVLLGAVDTIPSAVFDGSIKYLGVQVEADPEMRPLKPMVSVPYAYRALFVDGGGGNCGWVDDGTVVRLVDSTDQVGIGTQSPWPGVRLHLKGDYANVLYDPGTDTTFWLLGTSDPGNEHFFLSQGDQYGWTVRARVYTNGNVVVGQTDGKMGVGSSSPRAKLDVGDSQGSAGLFGGTVAITNLSGYIDPGEALGQLFFYGHDGGEQVGAEIRSTAVEEWTPGSAAANLSLMTTPSGASVPAERMTITEDGNVGIGTTSTAYKLQVHQATQHALSYVTTDGQDNAVWGFTGDLDGTVKSGSVGLDYSESTVKLLYGLAFDGSSNGIVIDSSGSVGIGTTSPQGALDVNSTTGALIVPRMTTAQRDALTAMNGMIIYNTTTNQFNFYENGAWVTK